MFSRLFRSRWTAAIWAAGVLWTAYDIVGSAPPGAKNSATAKDATGEPVDAAALTALANAAAD